MNSTELLAFVMHDLAEMKAQEVVVLDVRSLTQITDSMVVCTGTSSRHTQSIANSLVAHAKAQGVMPIGVEGETYGDWILAPGTAIFRRRWKRFCWPPGIAHGLSGSK